MGSSQSSLTHLMEKLLLTLALAATAIFAHAQGTIQFANNAGTRFNLCVRPTNPAGVFTFAVFAGLTADNLSSQPVGDLGWSTGTAGLISSPSAQAHQLPGFEPNTIAFLQIRGWESRFPTWHAGQEGLHGQTAVRSVLLGPASGPGTVIWSATDLTKFQAIDFCPEPSTLALAGLGFAGLLLFHRCKKF
jgi:hypothetical protein